MEFWKMHGLKNDYIFVQTFTQAGPGDPAETARALSAPHTGIGADGLILVEPDREADARMRIFNADGSEAQICGNGLRCAARLLYDQGLVTRPEMTISTGSGLRQVWLHIELGAVTSVTADMGAPVIGEAVELTGAGRTLRLELPPELEAMLPADKRESLRAVLARDPRPQYQENAERVYAMDYAGFEVRFTVEGETLQVTELRPAAERERAEEI